MDLHNLSAERAPINEVANYKQGKTKLLSGSSVSQQSFFPLAVDDYFMAVAILTRGIRNLKDYEVWSNNKFQELYKWHVMRGCFQDQVGVCVVSNESPRVLGIGRKGM